MDKKFLQLLACPVCKKAIFLKKKKLYCPHCHIWYPMRHGVPVMVDLHHLSPHLRGQIEYFKPDSMKYGTAWAIGYWQQKYIQSYFSHRKTWNNTIFVDDACGAGYMSIEAAKRGAHVLACDLNLSGLLSLKKHVTRLGLADKIFFICCSAEQLPIRTACVDGIVANAILEHLPNEKEAIRDMSRVAKRGAIAMITVPLAYYLLNPLFILIHVIYDKQIGHLRRYTKNTLLRRFMGWRCLKVQYTGHTAKVLKTGINLFMPIFSEKHIEEEDERFSKREIFASNINVLLKKE